MMNSRRTDQLKRQIKNLKASLRRANGFGGFTKTIEIRVAIEKQIENAQLHFDRSKNNDRKFGCV